LTSPAQRLSLALPRLQRAERGRALAGVASGIAATLDVDATLVRLVLALLAFASGAGIAAYLGLWLLLPLDGALRPSRRRQVFGGALLLLALSLALRGFGLADALVWPVMLVALGIWLLRGHRRFGLPPLLGAVFVFGGAVLFVDRNTGGGRQPLLSSGAVAVGVLAVVAPWLWRLARERDSERAQRIRTEERAELAARVHDSVLQTLALIQKEDDPRRVAALARRQERELRAWLYPDAGRLAGDETLAAALEAAASDVEELHGVRVDVVRSGDCALDERVEALVLAAREAMANAARHSGADEVSVFVDADADAVSVFVRDRGAGFDADAIPPDRHGIAESIRGRLERVGGTAVVAAAPGEGTEIELRLERTPA
jgi:signal transduction histidine kinase